MWNALTDTAKMRKWCFPQLRTFEPTVGFKFQFDDDSSEYQKEWIVTKLVQGRTLAHSWAYRDYALVFCMDVPPGQLEVG